VTFFEFGSCRCGGGLKIIAGAEMGGVIDRKSEYLEESWSSEYYAKLAGGRVFGCE
jgi:hypothetical protein